MLCRAIRRWLFTACFARRFILPLKQCEFALTSIIENLQRDPWPVKQEDRPQRCTGVAMNVAVSLLEVCAFSPF